MANKFVSIKNTMVKEASDDAKQKADVADSSIGLKLVGVNSLSIEESETGDSTYPLAQEPVGLENQYGNATDTMTLFRFRITL